MKRTNNYSFEIAAIKVFLGLYELIKEDEIDNIQIEFNWFYFNYDILGPLGKFEHSYLYWYQWWRSWISLNLKRYSIVDIISKYNKDLASEINKMNLYKIEHPKSKKPYQDLIMPLAKAFDNNSKYFNDKFKSI